MGPETLAALKHGRYIYAGMTYVEVIKPVSKLGLGYRLFTAVKMENIQRKDDCQSSKSAQMGS